MKYKTDKILVIILGTERSGTTLMRGILRFHKDLSGSEYDYDLKEGIGYNILDGKFLMEKILRGQYSDLSPNMNYIFMVTEY